jgi:hypothetical protein
MLRLRAPDPAEPVNSGLLQTFPERYSKTEFGVTANALGRGCRTGVRNDQLFGIYRRRLATPTIAQKVIQGRLNLLLYRIGAPVAHVGMLGIGLDDIDTVFLCLLDGRQYAGIGFEIRIL